MLETFQIVDISINISIEARMSFLERYLNPCLG